MKGLLLATNRATVAGDFHSKLEAGCRHNIPQEATTSNKSFLGSGGNRINTSGQALSCWGVFMTLSPPRQCGAVEEAGVVPSLPNQPAGSSGTFYLFGNIHAARK